MKYFVKNRIKTISIAVFIAAVAAIVVAVVMAKNQPSAFSLRDCTGKDCVVYLEDLGNTCTWKNGQVHESTLVYSPSESMKRVSVSKDQVSGYLKDAQSTNKCTRPEQNS